MLYILRSTCYVVSRIFAFIPIVSPPIYGNKRTEVGSIKSLTNVATEGGSFVVGLFAV